MTIQFRCLNCQQPIEVDDQYAGQTAACPYCSHVVTVPAESTYQTDSVVTARPTAQRPGEAVPPLMVEHRQASQRLAAAYGRYALICTAIWMALFGIMAVRTMSIMKESGLLSPATRPAATQPGTAGEERGPAGPGGMTEEQLRRLQARASSDPWIAGSEIGALFFGVTSLVLALISLRHQRRGNWQAFTALILCGLFMICMCGGALVYLVGNPGARVA
jgi:DNA-directed RNA polymerase subunit RPC12/RpoP